MINKNSLFLALLLYSHIAFSQCGPVISTFPYSEGFETSQAWTSGGTNSDWAWGAPAHATINSAGGGNKSWMIGGLTGSFYNNSELSWLMSPCFDFTSLNYPWISFKIFWEDEWKEDGMVLQYSTNSGTTWTNVGAFGDAVNCLNQHWYDYGNINHLTSANPKNGWTGRTGPTSGSCFGGNGSLGWVTAKHCMSALANQPNVRFRFLFGAGTTCNAYDGIAIDDIFIDNAPPNVANFTHSCTAPNTILFTNTSAMCPTGYHWDFGDGATSTIQNTSHTYSSAGTYNVTLTSSGPCNAPSSVTVPVTILSVTASGTNVTCNGLNNGTATATVLPASATVSYLWMPSGQTTANLSALAPGTYTVTVSSSGTCSVTATAAITQPIAINATTVVTPVSCFGGSNGTTTVTASGGNMPYAYLWTGGVTTPTNSGLGTGTYTVTVTDLNNCSATATSVINQPAAALSVSASSTPVSCVGSANGTATAMVTGGTSPYNYSWSPTGGTAALATGLVANTYTVAVIDNNLCNSSATTTVASPSSIVAVTTSTTNVSCFAGNNGTANAMATGGTLPYSYVWSPSGATTATIVGLTANTYTVTVTDAGGICTATTTAIVSQPLSALNVTITTTPAICTQINGTATATATGGTAPYTYAWLPTGGTGIEATSLAVGTYTVAVSDSHNCTTSASTVVIDTGSIRTSISFTPITCITNGTVLVSSENGTAPYSYIWNTGATTPDLTNLNAGEYTVSATDANGCADTAAVVLFNPSPMVSDFTFNPPFPSLLNAEISFYTQASGAINWQWNFGDGNTGNTDNPIHDYVAEGTYPITLIATNNLGCSDTVVHTITIEGGFTFYSPNAFTPNHDGNNDTFLPKGTGWDASTFELWIYDRWGETIFFSNNADKGWDGTINTGSQPVKNDVYIWKVNLKDVGGNQHNYIGSVLIAN